MTRHTHSEEVLQNVVRTGDELWSTTHLATACIIRMIKKITLLYLNELCQTAIPNRYGEPNLEEYWSPAPSSADATKSRFRLKDVRTRQIIYDHERHRKGEECEAAVVGILLVRRCGMVKNEVKDPVDPEVK